MLIGLCGYMQSGKDTVGGFLIGLGFRRVAFADPVKQMALAVDPWVDISGLDQPDIRFIRLSQLYRNHGGDWERLKAYPDVRRLLQRVGTEAVRDIIGKDTWITLGLSKVQGPTVITDCRFPNEADAIKAAGGKVWRIKRSGQVPGSHPSETQVDKIVYDDLILNNGSLDDLQAQVRAMAGDIVDTGFMAKASTLP